MIQTIELPWPPSVNSAYRSIVVKGQVRVLISKEGREYKNEVRMLLLEKGIRSFGQDRVAVKVRCYPPDNRPARS